MTKVVTKITEYFYEYTVKYQLSAIIRVGETTADNITLRSQSANQEVVTRLKQFPFPIVETFRHDLDIRSLLSMSNANFSINRMHTKCFTPVRNPDVEKAVVFFHRMYKWWNKLERYSTETVTTALSRPLIFNVEEISKAAREVFIPLVPLFAVPPELSAVAAAMAEDNLGESNVAVPVEHCAHVEAEQNLAAEDVSLLLQEHRRPSWCPYRRSALRSTSRRTTCSVWWRLSCRCCVRTRSCRSPHTSS